jgi:ribosomal protein L14
MVYLLTNLVVADTSGARTAQCINILGASNRKFANFGDIVVVVVKRIEPNHPKMKRGKICRALVISLVFVIIVHRAFGLVLGKMRLYLQIIVMRL